jgi:asparagine synthase (glutamine-hydrolysing)
MCGIVGFLDFNKCATRDDLLAMKKTLKHRGPDGEGVMVSEEENYVFGLGHQRLSIIDLSDFGHQPMVYENLSISFNGEIYNYKEIKLSLLDLGHKFQGDSDTEVILHAFQQWGISCIHKFIGMFAFVIYDTQKKEVFCVRDRAGIKPFFYYFQDGLFLFASELKAFHQLDSFKKVLNEDALSLFLQVGNIPAPHTIYANCFKLSPGNYLQLNTESKENFVKSMVSREYWNVYDSYNKPKLKVSFQEAKFKTQEILSSACAYRMVADVPVGIFLSGGYDSTAVTAILQKSSPQPLKTFTISVPDIGLNEADEAAKIAEFIGTDHTEIHCGVKEAIDKIPDLAYYYDEPFADSSAIPTMLVSEAARKSVTVALSADGGDEVFAGYNRYDYMMKYQRKFSATPKFMRELMSNLMDKIPAEKLPVLRHKYNFHQRYEKLKMLLKDPSEKNFMLSLSKQFTEEDLDLILRKKNKLILTAYQSTELLKEFSTPLSFMLAIDYQTYLPDDILQKVDRATMHVGLEGREPLLDHRLIEYVAQLPDEFKYHKGKKKFLLKEIVHDLVPKDLMDRPKKGFGIPIASWMQNEIAFLLDEYLNEHDIQHQGLFNWEPIKQIVAAFKSGKLEYTNKVWYLLVFQMWYKKWMK